MGAPNQDILQNLQLVYNLLPNLSRPELQRALAIKNNDHSVSVYVASIVRSVLALDRLIDNKIENRDRMMKKEEEEREKEKKALKKKSEKDAAAAEKKEGAESAKGEASDKKPAKK